MLSTVQGVAGVNEAFSRDHGRPVKAEPGVKEIAQNEYLTIGSKLSLASLTVESYEG
jgi:hypothetical protein